MIKWEWYTDSKMVHLFVHLLLSANHERSNWRGVNIERGQLITGVNSISSATGISAQSIRTGLNRLKSTSEITIKSTNKYSIITICNYDDYQYLDYDTNKQITSQLTNEQQTTNKQLTTNNNNKELNNENKLKKFIKPEISEISDYCIERNNGIDSNYFFDYYESNGWMVGRTKMKDWKSTIRNWERNNLNRPKQNGTEPKPNRIQQAIQLQADVEQMIIEQKRINDLKNG